LTAAPAPAATAARPSNAAPKGYVVAAAPLAPPMPEFHWPPPKASAWDLIPNELVTGGAPSPTFAAVEQRLGRALDAAGYHQRSFFTVPNGFALVTQLERIEPNGSPSGARRWMMAEASADFSLESYFKRLLYADPGRYRLVVLIVSDVPFSATGGYLTMSEASDLAGRGVNTLPENVAEDRYSPRHRCTALIYEFRKTSTPNAELVVPSPLPGRDHLIKARIWVGLESPRKN
jgi:hypothetical protein